MGRRKWSTRTGGRRGRASDKQSNTCPVVVLVVALANATCFFSESRSEKESHRVLFSPCFRSPPPSSPLLLGVVETFARRGRGEEEEEEL